MTIKQVAVTIIKTKNDPDQNTLRVIISVGPGQWNNIQTKQELADKFNEYEVAVTPFIDFGLISTKNYKLRIINNAYKLFVVPNDQDPFDLDFSLIRMTENASIRSMAVAIYYQTPNIYLDQITGSNTVDYTLQHNCNFAISRNRGLSLKIDEYLNGNDNTCISNLWRYGVENNVNYEIINSTPQQRLITKLFNKL